MCQNLSVTEVAEIFKLANIFTVSEDIREISYSTLCDTVQMQR